MIASLESHPLVLLAVSVPAVLLLAGLASRVLGVRSGPVAALVAAAGGWIAGLVAASSLHPDETRWRVAVALLFAFLGTLLLTVVLELLTRPGGHRARPSPGAVVHPLRAVRRRVEPLRRGRQVAHIARANGLLHLRYAGPTGLEDPELGRRLADTLQQCGGVLVKFGQIASTRTDVLPPTVTGPLSDLQADVQPAPADQVRPELEAGLGRPVDEVFAEFDWTPLAAASVGQTYRARLHDGQAVVVKCRRPGIVDLVDRDADALLELAHLVDGAAGRGPRLTKLATELVRNVRSELDYLQEAANATQLAANRADDPGIAIPAVHPELGSAGVLVMDFARGEPVGRPGAVAASARPPVELARNLLASFLGQILQDGTYHADPHPGNVLVTPEGELELIDFGSVGHLDPILMSGLQLLALGVSLSDPTIVVKGLVRIGSAPAGVDRSALEADVSRILGEELQGGGLDATTIREVLTVMEHHGIGVPEAFVVLSRALVCLEGTLRLIDPTFDFGTEATAIVSSWYGGRRALDDDQMLKHELVRSAVLLRDLPAQIDEAATALLAGRLTLRTARYGVDDAVVVGAWFDRAVVAATGAVALVTGAVLLLGAAVSGTDELRAVLTGLGLFSLVSGSVLALRAVARSLSPGLRRR